MKLVDSYVLWLRKLCTGEDKSTPFLQCDHRLALLMTVTGIVFVVSVVCLLNRFF